MDRENALVSLLGEEIRGRLGNGYEVNTNFLSASIEGGGHPAPPDLVIWSKADPKRVYIVEVKIAGPNQDFDLPLATANQTKRILRANQLLFDTVLILATNAHVGKLLQTELDSQNVEVVRSDQAAQLAADIVEKIRSSSTRAASASISIR